MAVLNEILCCIYNDLGSQKVFYNSANNLMWNGWPLLVEFLVLVGQESYGDTCMVLINLILEQI